MIDLNDLKSGLPAITPAFGGALAEAGGVCLESQGHSRGKRLQVQGDYNNEYQLVWPEVTEQVLRCWNDAEVATEYGAVAIAVLLARRETGFTVIQRSRKGTGFDYWLGNDDTEPFQNKARLEISGIRIGNDRSIHDRVNRKLSQTDRSDGVLPAYVIVVEFSRPIAEMRAK